MRRTLACNTLLSLNLMITLIHLIFSKYKERCDILLYPTRALIIVFPTCLLHLSWRSNLMHRSFLRDSCQMTLELSIPQNLWGFGCIWAHSHQHWFKWDSFNMQYSLFHVDQCPGRIFGHNRSRSSCFQVQLARCWHFLGPLINLRYILLILLESDFSWSRKPQSCHR